MSTLNNKQFGVWMDTRNATVVGFSSPEATQFTVLGHIEKGTHEHGASEHTEHNATRTLQAKYFKEIAFLMQNAEEVHVTGTGTEQEQFIHYLSETPQFKKVVAKESTSNKMSDERLLEYITAQFS